MTTITNASQTDYPTLLIIWEASVRATHHFLPEESIQELKPLILNEYFAAVELICSRDDKGMITGFAGIADNKLEMLFIHPDSRGQGIGKALLQHAIDYLQVNGLDVNEQNPQAVGFYLHQGFQVIDRSEIDGQGNPYPLLHMKLVRS